MSPRCLPAVLALSVGRRSRGRGGGGRSRCPPYCASTSEARRTHEARHLSLRWGGGLPCGSRRHPTLPAVAPPAAPPLGHARRVLPLGTVVWFVPHSRPSAPPPCRGVLGGGSAARYRLPSCPLAFSPLPSPLPLVGVGGGGGGGGGGAPSLPFLRRKHVAGTALARGTALVLLLGCGARRVAPVFALPSLRSLPRCPPRWGQLGACASGARSCSPSRTLSPLPPHRAALSSGGGAAVRPFLLASPALGGGEAWGGGACRFPSVALASQARGAAPVPLLGGGGFASRLPSSPLLPYARSPGGPPAGACRARALYGHGRVARPAPSYLCLPTLPRCPRGGGGGAFRPPPTRIPALGEAVVLGGGRGVLFASPPLHARRRHDVGTTQPRGEALGCSRRGGGFPFGLSRPAPWYRPRTPGSPAGVAPSAVVATSPHGAQCPVPAPSRAHTYWRRYVPGWIRKTKRCGQRGGLTVRLEGFLRHPPPWSRGGPLFRHPTARGGATAHPLPGACVSTSERPDTGAVVSVRWRWRLQSGRALSSPGPLPTPSAMEAPEVLWQRRGEADGGFICGIPWPPS